MRTSPMITSPYIKERVYYGYDKMKFEMPERTPLSQSDMFEDLEDRYWGRHTEAAYPHMMM